MTDPQRIKPGTICRLLPGHADDPLRLVRVKAIQDTLTGVRAAVTVIGATEALLGDSWVAYSRLQVPPEPEVARPRVGDRVTVDDELGVSGWLAYLPAEVFGRPAIIPTVAALPHCELDDPARRGPHGTYLVASVTWEGDPGVQSAAEARKEVDPAAGASSVEDMMRATLDHVASELVDLLCAVAVARHNPMLPLPASARLAGAARVLAELDGVWDVMRNEGLTANEQHGPRVRVTVEVDQ